MHLSYFFKQTIVKGASDLILVEGSFPCLRISGELVKIENEKIIKNSLKHAIYNYIDEETKEAFQKNKEVDFAIDFENYRFRINLHYQRGEAALAARLIPDKIPSPHELGFTEAIYQLTHLKDGLVIVAGPTGCGKSTTLASMINIINTERRAHIITIEDPIEYIFKDIQSIIEQREIGKDTKSFDDALKHVLRQDPNVIMVGEMRDYQTISAAMAAAKTGHLVLSTLHTCSAAETVERIVDVFPAEFHNQVATELAIILRGVISQQLIPAARGGLVVAREIMITNRAISNLIRNKEIAQIKSVIQTSAKEGMIPMDKSIDILAKNGIIDPVIANNRKKDFEIEAAYY